MKNKLLPLLVSLLVSATGLAQSRKGEVHLSPKSKAHRLYVSFKHTLRPDNEQNYNAAIEAFLPGYKELEAQYGITAKKGIAISTEKLEELEELAVKNTGSGASVARLSAIAELTIADADNEKMLQLALELEKLDGVAYCSLMPVTPVKPPYDIAPVTANFLEAQNYTGPIGVNMQYAWDMGLTGQDINIRDVEYGFNPNHEELNERNVSFGGGIEVSSELSTDYTEHGTGVLGVVYADNGDYGITGLAYGANEVVLFSELGELMGQDRVYAISKSIDNSTLGDFIMYEMQTYGNDENYVLAEYDNPVWDLTKAATDAGIIVVAAAGNGGENLNSMPYTSYMQRGNSGAIIVGAGTNDELHDRLSFSTYGSRVDLQGWGTGVLSSGYGDAFTIGDDFNQTYTMFSGTSSATPIVTSCAVVLQSYYHNQTGEYLSGTELKELLKETGAPQGEGLNGHVGPLPQMPQAIAALEALMGVKSVEKNIVTAYPNPVHDRLTLVGNFSDMASAEVFNALGQSIYHTTAISNGIDFSQYAKGIYIVKVTDGDKTVSKKIVKQ
jgi:hypothetical protein